MAIRKTGAAADQVIYDEAAQFAEQEGGITAEAAAQAEPTWTDRDEAALTEEDFA